MLSYNLPLFRPKRTNEMKVLSIILVVLLCATGSLSSDAHALGPCNPNTQVCS